MTREFYLHGANSSSEGDTSKFRSLVCRNEQTLRNNRQLGQSQLRIAKYLESREYLPTLETLSQLGRCKNHTIGNFPAS
eukprot:1338623-Amorphochlora_amoeboformis.AAC.1